jgi:hypothetical protein
MTTDSGVVEKKMLAGLAFLTDGNMTVGGHGDDLIARISADDTDSALTRAGARPFDITGRPMRGWILVAGETPDRGDGDRDQPPMRSTPSPRRDSVDARHHAQRIWAAGRTRTLLASTTSIAPAAVA